MTNAQVLCISLALLACIANCQIQDDGGYHVINTPSNGDPGSCILSLNLTVEVDGLLFTVTQSPQAPGMQDCTHQDLQFAPLYRNMPAFTGQITMVPTANNASVLTGKLTKDLFTQFDGKGCANLGPYNNETWLKCRFKFGSIFFSVDWYMKVDGNYDTNWTGLLYPQQAQTVETSMNGMNVQNQNMTYQDLVGMTYDSCGSWSNVITNGNSHITITGTQFQSNYFDFSHDLGDLTLYAILVKSATSGQYKAWQPDESYDPFANPAANYCTDIGVSYTTVLQGLDCTGGCYLTLLLYDNVDVPAKAFDLMSQGFSTSFHRLRA